MRSAFTVVLEPRGDGWTIAYAAEFPKTCASGNTAEEARAKLYRLLERRLNRSVRKALAQANQAATVEELLIERPSVSGSLDAARAATRKQRGAERESDFLQALLDEGLIAALPAKTDDDDVEPVPMEGKPISEEIIEGRR